MLQKIKFILSNLSSQDKKLLILSFVVFILLFFNGCSVQAGSNTSRVISEEEFWNIIKNADYDVPDNISLNDFTGAVSGLRTNLLSESRSKFFSSFINGIDGHADGKFIVSSPLYNNNNYKPYFLLQGSVNAYSLCISPNLSYNYEVDLINKTITYYYSYNYDSSNLPNFMVFNKAGLSESEFSSFTYFKESFYKYYFYNAGPFYYTDRTQVLNNSISLKVDSYLSGDITITGDLTYSYNGNIFYLNLTSNNLPIGNYNCFLTYYYISANSNIPVIDRTTYTPTVYLFEYDGLNSSYSIPITADMLSNLKGNYPFSSEEFTGLGFSLSITNGANINYVSNPIFRTDMLIPSGENYSNDLYFLEFYNYEVFNSEANGLFESDSPGDTDSSGDIIYDDNLGNITNESGDTTGKVELKNIFDVIANLPKMIIEGIVGLFIPDQDYFYNEDEANPGLWQRFSDFFSKKLGFLWDVLMFIPNLVKSLLDMIASATEYWGITTPDITVPAMTGVEETVIIKSFFWSPYDWVNQREEFYDLYVLYLNIIDLFVYWGLVRYAIRTVMNVFGNSDETIIINE